MLSQPSLQGNAKRTRPEGAAAASGNAQLQNPFPSIPDPVRAGVQVLGNEFEKARDNCSASCTCPASDTVGHCAAVPPTIHSNQGGQQ